MWGILITPSVLLVECYQGFLFLDFNNKQAAYIMQGDMTAEIALLNRQAVALAADSAVTIQHEAKLKVRPTANKIFQLSKYNPVGVMVYDQSTLVGVPWETLIKGCREDLGTRSLSTIDEYADYLFHFIGTSGIISVDLQGRAYVGSLRAYYSLLEDQLINEMKNREDSGLAITSTVANREFATLVKTHEARWLKADYLTSDGQARTREVRKEFGDKIRETIDDAFGRLRLSDATYRRLVRIACLLPVKWPSVLTPPMSGIVVAGFGTESTFPSLRAYKVAGLLYGVVKLQADSDSNVEVGLRVGAAIVPFAQRRWVDAFLFGLHPLYRTVLAELVADLVKGVSVQTIEGISSLTTAEKRAEKKSLPMSGTSAVVREKLTELDRYTDNEFVQPVVSTLASLPKEELADIAEALVNLTSFRQQVTMDAETVGGPIDVALISRGDGFIWIKRKHYFEASLNPQFFATHYERGYDACQTGQDSA